MLSTETALADWLHLMRAEYLEIPGLHLTEPQVQRLWNLDSVATQVLLAALLDAKFLKQTRRGAYVRADQG